VKPLSSSSGFQPIVGGRTSCEGAEVACGYFAPERNAASFVTEAAAGPFFLWVDSETNVGGDFELELTFDDSPSVDSCSAPGVLRGGDVIDVTGDTAGLADDVSSSCGGAGAGDAVYRLRLDRPRRVRVEATGSLGFRPVVSIRSACADVASEAACAQAVVAATAALVEVPAAEAGDFFVIVDGAPTNGSGRFNLRISLSDPVPPPVNDDCSTAAELVLMSGVGRATVQGDTTRAKNDAVGCDGTGPDLVYSVVVSQPSTVRAHVTPLAGSRLQPVLYLRRELACMSETIPNQLFCTAAGQSGFPALVEVPRLEPGRYFLFVDGKSNTAGAFDLAVELGAPAAPPANDTCATATPVSLANGPVFLGRETTVGAAPDAHTCADEFLSPDVAYTVSVTSRQSLAIDLRALAGSRLLPVLTLKPLGACSVNALLPLGRCGYSDLQVPDRAVVVVPSLDPGAYSLWVSGDRATQGPFSLRLIPGPVFSPPMNDTCVSSLAYSLTVGSNVTGDTRAAGNHAQGSCGLPIGANGEAGADVAYLLQVAVPAPSLTVTVTPEIVGGTLMRPVIYVRGGPQATTCTPIGPNLGCQAAPDYGAPVSLTLTNVQPGTYTLWVDGAGLSAGSFAISVR
jgi:hypothetical protein